MTKLIPDRRRPGPLPGSGGPVIAVDTAALVIEAGVAAQLATIRPDPG